MVSNEGVWISLPVLRPGTGAAEPQWDPLGFVFIFVDVRWVQIRFWFQSDDIMTSGCNLSLRVHEDPRRVRVWPSDFSSSCLSIESEIRCQKARRCLAGISFAKRSSPLQRVHVHVAELLLTEIKYQNDQKHTRQNCWDNQSPLARFGFVWVCDKDRAEDREGD